MTTSILSSRRPDIAVILVAAMSLAAAGVAASTSGGYSFEDAGAVVLGAARVGAGKAGCTALTDVTGWRHCGR
jgi:hypothetical protein